MALWKATPLPNRDDELFSAIITDESGKQLIGQITSFQIAEHIVYLHNALKPDESAGQVCNCAGVWDCSDTQSLFKKEVNNMENLKELLVQKIGTLVEKADETDVQLLDALNRLLGTVTNYLLAQQDRNKNDAA